MSLASGPRTTSGMSFPAHPVASPRLHPPLQQVHKPHRVSHAVLQVPWGQHGAALLPFTRPTTTANSSAKGSVSIAAAAAAAAAATPAATAPALVCAVQQAATPAELRAAAFLRAVSFYTYPPGRSEYAARSHRHMKANAEWESVTAKVEVDDVDPGYGRQATAPTTITTTVTASEGDGAELPAASQHCGSNDQESGALLAALRSCLDACAQLPAEPGSSASASPRPRRLVVGSLDLNVGHTLPSEELIGRHPQFDPRHRRAYLSNVCVAPAARRLGVARSLLRHVEEVARGAGVQWLYVHVVANNTPAVALYCNALGFQVEQSESEGYARALQRPPRLLLAKCLTGPAVAGPWMAGQDGDVSAIASPSSCTCQSVRSGRRHP
ncbi:hypothetical protein VOLCADRAFT_106017 [Volvox carteri f. nagariensis]|uniref:N-acetyltransferase domain-containing protein n=1 Tax=Volvox carteri f. nagariensis TaxID=3068 RepID=D8U4K3_VOLCA|nr:uncharacterized protein VOLCADRAFT_106017 [Volvox carteri f. nagariensis]EFJ45206.1 hypothetical protein VOLCADRAFT_106017 [Volvox carteri f. nagariensis]|eukprot:XP_002953582.1 hypothetical protein VOLCADRAFT_106017 [Volvox carteri f. nagariensis]